jgi:hypothetical protein
MPELHDLFATPDQEDTGVPLPGRRVRVLDAVQQPEPEPRLVRRADTGRVYVTTEYSELDDGGVVPHQLYDVTEDFEQLSEDPHVPFGPALYAIASRVYDVAVEMNPDATRASRIDAIASSLAYTFRGPSSD